MKLIRMDSGTMFSIVLFLSFTSTTVLARPLRDSSELLSVPPSALLSDIENKTVTVNQIADHTTVNLARLPQSSYKIQIWIDDHIIVLVVVATAALLLILGTCWWYCRIDEESNSGSGFTYPVGEGGKALPPTRIDEDSNRRFTSPVTLSDSNPKGLVTYPVTDLSLVTKNLHSNLVSEGGKAPPPTRTDEDSNPEGLVTYHVRDLILATKNFSDSNLVGQGGFARVYRADLEGNRIAAVKKLLKVDSTLFGAELSILLRLQRHPNLVNLLGICSDPDNQMIVFEYVANGTLFTRLHEYQGDAGPLSWASRKKIARQVAEALKHLHGKPDPRIIHRDVKSKNVLLENDNYAKLADFGIAKLGPKNNQSTRTTPCGTPGYMDPQYWNGGKCSPKSDVYSFGVLLLELITGSEAVIGTEALVIRTRTDRLSEDTNNIIKIVDPSLTNGNNRHELLEMIRIANRCLRRKREKRPTMTEVVNMMSDKIRNE